MPQKAFGDKSKLVQVMVWCQQTKAITWANFELLTQI